MADRYTNTWQRCHALPDRGVIAPDINHLLQALRPWLLLLMLAGCGRGGDVRLEMPQLDDADYYWIAGRVFQNETNSQLRYLTHWNDGEDFPSLGIGHFIWFPDEVDAPFDESFPRMLNYLKAQRNECAPVPDWLSGADVPAAPWASKADFEVAYDEPQLAELRAWLAATAPQQAQYIAASFEERWNVLDAGDRDKAELTALLQRLLGERRGLFAVIDYFNFKGLGSNPRERYAGEGWGLVQVLGDIAASSPDDDADLVALFSAAAADRLALRVANSPSERNEQRWLEGWHKRVAAYNAAARAASASADDFRVAPFVQDVRNGKATLVWFSRHATPGSARIATEGRLSQASAVRKACALDYHLAEYPDVDRPRAPPFRHTVTFDALLPGQQYEIDIRQGASQAAVSLRTATIDSVHFVVYGDSETEPESTGAHARWTTPGSNDERSYLVDQTAGYAANLAVIAAKQPDFVAIAGDLVESGGEQRDWDEFWQQNAALAASVPILPARGNHEYFAGPGQLGGYADAQRAIAKYESYFAKPPYYVHDHGSVALIVLDVNNGVPERAGTDTNWFLDNSAPDWQAGSEQYQWLEQTLQKAQREKAFTFVMFHHAPYSSGIHGRPPGTDKHQNFSSGQPLQSLTPLLHRYGVDAVFTGHDELYEHSQVVGEESLTDGTTATRKLHFFTVGIGGDGLRGSDALAPNPHRTFLAHEDAPERWSSGGVLQEGGKHYGHLDVRVERIAAGRWQARFEPVYVLPVLNAAGELQEFAPHRYDDVLLLERTFGN